MRWNAFGTVVALVEADITSVPADVVVNAANAALAGGGGVDGAIHRAAGPSVQQACNALPFVRPGVRCPTGEVRATVAGNLRAQHIVHAVGPIYDARAPAASDRALASAYTAALTETVRLGGATVVLPALSTGAFRFPVRLAARVAAKAVAEFLQDHPAALTSVTFALFSARDHAVFVEAFDLTLGQ